MENNALKRVKVASAFATHNEKLLFYDQILSLNWKNTKWEALLLFMAKTTWSYDL